MPAFGRFIRNDAMALAPLRILYPDLAINGGSSKHNTTLFWVRIAIFARGNAKHYRDTANRSRKHAPSVPIYAGRIIKVFAMPAVCSGIYI